MCWQRINLFWTTWIKFNILYTVVHAYLTWCNTMRNVKKKKNNSPPPTYTLKETLNCILQTRWPLFLLIKYQTWTCSKALPWMKVKQIGKRSCIGDCFNGCVCNTAHLNSPAIKIKCKSTSLFCISSQIFYTYILLCFTYQCSTSLEWNIVYYFRNSHNDQKKSV